MLESPNYNIETEEIRLLASAYELERPRDYIAFSSRLESAFQTHHRAAFLLHRRVSLCILLVFVFLIGLLDLGLFGTAWISIAPVKNVVIAVVVALVIALVRTDYFERWQYSVLTLTVCLLSALQAASMLYLPDSVYSHYSPMFLVSTIVVGVCMHLPMTYYLVTVVMTWLGFNAVLVLLDPQPVSIQVGYNSYFLLAAFLGGCLLYMLERGARRQYVKSRLMVIEKDELNCLTQQLEQLDNVEPITGLSNAKHFKKSLGVEWHRCIRNGKTLSVLMVEMDGFEEQIHLFGQRFAEKYLFDVSAVLSQSFKRAADLIAIDEKCRYLVMLPDVEQTAVKMLCERVQTRVLELGLTYPETDAPITVSIGQATCVPEMHDSRTDLLSWAKKALKRAQSQSRQAYAVMVPDVDEGCS